MSKSGGGGKRSRKNSVTRQTYRSKRPDLHRKVKNTCRSSGIEKGKALAKGELYSSVSRERNRRIEDHLIKKKSLLKVVEKEARRAKKRKERKEKRLSDSKIVKRLAERRVNHLKSRLSSVERLQKKRSKLSKKIQAQVGIKGRPDSTLVNAISQLPSPEEMRAKKRTIEKKLVRATRKLSHIT